MQRAIARTLRPTPSPHVPGTHLPRDRGVYPDRVPGLLDNDDGVVGHAAGEAGGIFFPVRAAELKLWVDGKSGKLLPPPGGVLLTPALLDDAGKAVTAPTTYRLTSPTSPGQTPNLAWLTVDAKTGTLKVTEHREYHHHPLRVRSKTALPESDTVTRAICRPVTRSG